MNFKKVFHKECGGVLLTVHIPHEDDEGRTRFTYGVQCSKCGVVDPSKEERTNNGSVMITNGKVRRAEPEARVQRVTISLYETERKNGTEEAKRQGFKSFSRFVAHLIEGAVNA